MGELRSGPDAVAKRGREVGGQAVMAARTCCWFPATIDSVQRLPYNGETLTAGITDTAHLYQVWWRFDPPIPIVRGSFHLRTSPQGFSLSGGSKRVFEGRSPD